MRSNALAWFIAASALTLAGTVHAEQGGAASERQCVNAPAPGAVALEAFGAIARAYRTRLPGPAGGAALDRKVGELVGAYLDFDAFATRVLGQAAKELDADEKRAWTERLATVIETRYLHRMGSPIGAHLAVRSVTFDCPQATLALAVTHRDTRKNKDFEVVVVWSDGAWRGVDAIVDEVSLLALYRGRFVRAYRDGGLAGARAYLDALHARYGAGDGGADDPIE